MSARLSRPRLLESMDSLLMWAAGLTGPITYINSAQIFDAAARLKQRIRADVSADMCCGNGLGDVEDMMRRFANDARYFQVYFKHNGISVLTTFAGDALGVPSGNRFARTSFNGRNPSTTPEPTVRAEVSGPPSNTSLPIFLVPAFFWGGELPARPQVQSGFDEWSSNDQ